MCRTYVENQIDFRCSDSWQDYYFERGITPFHSPSYRSCTDRLADDCEKLRHAINDMVVSLRDLAHEGPGQTLDLPRYIPDASPVLRPRYTKIP